MTPEVDDLKFDVERLETAVDVLAASVNAATIRAETAEAEVEQLRRQRDALRDEVAELRERAVDVIVSRGVDPKDPEGVTLRIEGNGQAWDFKVANFTRYTTPPKWDITRRAERAEAAIERVRALCGDARAVWDEEPDAWRSGGVPEPIVAVVDVLSAIDLEAP